MRLSNLGGQVFFKGCKPQSSDFVPGYVSDNTSQATFYTDPDTPAIYKIELQIPTATKEEEQVIASNQDLEDLLPAIHKPGIFSPSHGEGIIIIPVPAIPVTAKEYVRYLSGQGGTYQRDGIGDMDIDDVLRIIKGLFPRSADRILRHLEEEGILDFGD